MSCLQERIYAIMSNATARGGTVKVTLPLADLRALAEEAERLRCALDSIDENLQMAIRYDSGTRGTHVSQAWLQTQDALAASVLYDEDRPETP